MKFQNADKNLVRELKKDPSILIDYYIDLGIDLDLDIPFRFFNNYTEVCVEDTFIFVNNVKTLCWYPIKIIHNNARPLVICRGIEEDEISWKSSMFRYNDYHLPYILFDKLKGNRYTHIRYAVNDLERAELELLDEIFSII